MTRNAEGKLWLNRSHTDPYRSAWPKPSHVVRSPAGRHVKRVPAQHQPQGHLCSCSTVTESLELPAFSLTLVKLCRKSRADETLCRTPPAAFRIVVRSKDQGVLKRGNGNSSQKRMNMMRVCDPPAGTEPAPPAPGYGGLHASVGRVFTSLHLQETGNDKDDSRRRDQGKKSISLKPCCVHPRQQKRLVVSPTNAPRCSRHECGLTAGAAPPTGPPAR